MTSRLYYTKIDGKKGYATYHSSSPSGIALSSKGITSIDFSPLSGYCNLEAVDLSENYLQNINLTPLHSCGNLRDLNLSGNNLRSIDLTPLAECSNLRFLSLADNSLETVDLSPLIRCTHLTSLLLSNNNLRSIDLNPLSACGGLWRLELDKNKLERIDLAPLANCKELMRLSIPISRLQSIDLEPLANCNLHDLLFGKHLPREGLIDLTPLTFCDKLNLPTSLLKNRHSWLETKTNTYQYDMKARRLIMSRYGTYHRPTRVYSWQFLHRVLKKYATDLRVQQDVMMAMGLGSYGFIDANLHTTFLSISQEEPIEDVREHILPIIAKEIAKVIDRGGCTTGLDTEELFTRHGEISGRADRIFRDRKKELEHARIGLKADVADLRELYLTAYGYEILNALDMRLETDLAGLETVQHTFADLGYNLKTADEPVAGVNISDDLKQAIWWIVRNRGRAWSEIVSEVPL